MSAYNKYMWGGGIEALIVEERKKWSAYPASCISEGFFPKTVSPEVESTGVESGFPWRF